MSFDQRRERSKHALHCVQQWGSSRAKDHVKALPVLVRNMGLAGAIALQHSKDETRLLAADLVSWLIQPDLPGRVPLESPNVSEFLKHFVKLPEARCAFLEQEGLLFAEALKLFSGALNG